MFPRPPGSTLFPYTTLFRSQQAGSVAQRTMLALIAGLFAMGLCLVAAAQSVWAQRLGRKRSPKCDSRSEEHTSELQSPYELVCRLLPEKKKKRRKAAHKC